MLKSMTGFGTSTIENDKYRVTVDVKSLNSKFSDINVRLPKLFNDKEIEIRNLLSDKLLRGKISLSIDFQELVVQEPKARVNKNLVNTYLKNLQDASEGVEISTAELFKIALTMPQAVDSVSDGNDNDEEWAILKEALINAIEKCDKFRVEEGKTLEEKILSNINKIDELLLQVNEHDPKRVDTLKERVENRIKEFLGDDNVDKNRFEQEMIYYIEKLDINEEKVRLKTHLDYFKKTVTSKDGNGKKLNFISQEIGREINTTGAKANDATIQHLVVQMKEELEKIKEQLNNIL